MRGSACGSIDSTVARLLYKSVLEYRWQHLTSAESMDDCVGSRLLEEDVRMPRTNAAAHGAVRRLQMRVQGSFSGYKIQG